MGYVVELIDDNCLASLEASADLQAYFFEIEVNLICANALEKLHIGSHFVHLAYHLLINFGCEHVHVDAVLLGVDFLIPEHRDVPLGRTRNLPNEYANLGPQPQHLLVFLLIIVTDRILLHGGLLFFILRRLVDVAGGAVKQLLIVGVEDASAVVGL